MPTGLINFAYRNSFDYGALNDHRNMKRIP